MRKQTQHQFNQLHLSVQLTLIVGAIVVLILVASNHADVRNVVITLQALRAIIEELKPTD
jgi:hypothetical protein